MSEDDLDPAALRAAAKDEVRVVLPMEAWDELEYLGADDTEEPTDLPNVLLQARPDDDDVLCEGEEEGEEWAFYVRGFTVEELLPLVRGAIPEGWTAEVVPVGQAVFSGAQIALVRR